MLEWQQKSARVNNYIVNLLHRPEVYSDVRHRKYLQRENETEIDTVCSFTNISTIPSLLSREVDHEHSTMYYIAHL